MGSLGFTLKSMLPRKRVTPNDAAVPMATPISGQHDAVADDAAQHVSGLRAERHADADLVGAACDLVREQAIEPDTRQQKREQSEDT